MLLLAAIVDVASASFLQLKLILDKISDRLLLAGLFFTMTSFATEDLLPSLTLFFLPGGARSPARLWRFARPPDPPPAAVTTAPAPAAAPRVSVALAIVLFAECFKTSRTAFRGLFLPEIMFENSGTNEETKCLPNYLATGNTYFFTNGIATRPIRIANAPMPPEPNCRAGP